MAWLVQNIDSILAAAVLAAALALIVLRLIKNKRQGKHLCGGACSGCLNAGACSGRAAEKDGESGSPKTD